MADTHEIDVRVDHEAWQAALGAAPEDFVQRILETAIRAERAEGGVEVLLASDEAIRALNAQWRAKDMPTNVLSFPAPEGAGYLGDIVLAFETIESEARAQSKTLAAHTAHLLTHGLLHLLGYDHEADDEAEEMEARERTILATLGYADPYAVSAP